MADENNDALENAEEVEEAVEAAEGSDEEQEAAPASGDYDSNQAIKACHGILAAIVAGNEELNKAILGRFNFAQRQRVLAAGLNAASKTVELPWELQRQAVIKGGGMGGAGIFEMVE